MVGTLILNVMVLIKRQILGDKTSPLILRRGVTTMAGIPEFRPKIMFSLPLLVLKSRLILFANYGHFAEGLQLSNTRLGIYDIQM